MEQATGPVSTKRTKGTVAESGLWSSAQHSIRQPGPDFRIQHERTVFHDLGTPMREVNMPSPSIQRAPQSTRSTTTSQTASDPSSYKSAYTRPHADCHPRPPKGPWESEPARSSTISAGSAGTGADTPGAGGATSGALATWPLAGATPKESSTNSLDLGRLQCISFGFHLVCKRRRVVCCGLAFRRRCRFQCLTGSAFWTLGPLMCRRGLAAEPSPTPACTPVEGPPAFPTPAIYGSVAGAPVA